jgi:hypothetical protein
MSLWVRLLIGLGAIVGVILVGEALWPSMGIVGYVVSCVVFSVLAYYLDGLADKRRKPSRAPAVPMTPTYSPTQTTQPTRTQYALEQVRGMLQRVEERYNAGEIDRARYEQLLGELVFQDTYGRWWTIDHRTGKWVQNKDGTWVESEPPPWLER